MGFCSSRLFCELVLEQLEVISLNKLKSSIVLNSQGNFFSKNTHIGGLRLSMGGVCCVSVSVCVVSRASVMRVCVVNLWPQTYASTL